MQLKKADELEMAINFKSMRLSWIFFSFALLGWVVYEYIKSGEFLIIPLSIDLLQTIIFFASKLIITHRMSGGGNEE